MVREEIEALLALKFARGMGPTLIGRALASLGSARQVCHASAGDLARIRGVGSRRAEAVRRDIDQVFRGDEVDRELDRVEVAGAQLLAVTGGGEYPTLLRHIPDPPPLLYLKGTWGEEDAIALAIIGARRCTQYGRSQADRFAGLAAETGFCVVSGGAYGVDVAAHEAALRHGGRTIAVLGSGLDRPYPLDHVRLFDRIADQGGAIVSELPMGAPPLADHFPRRNRIISGLSLGVLVIEAAARSGALLTARLAVEEHGREVMAVPGRLDVATSEGCHRMIREGWATLVTGMGDVLDAMGETGHLLRVGGDVEDRCPKVPMDLSDSQRTIVAALEDPLATNQIASRTGLAVHVIQSDLTMLEIRGVVERSGGAFSLRG